MVVLTTAEMRLVDKQARVDLGIPSLVLMENAGVAVVSYMQQEFGDLSGKQIVIFAGSGNNGGDGLVVARHLLNKQAKVKVFIYGQSDKLSADCAHNVLIFEKLHGNVEFISSQSSGKLRISLSLADIVVDAILGTGAKGALRGGLADVVGLINKYTIPIVAIDIPTGVDATSGAVGNGAVKATHTIALGFLKTGLVLYPGCECCGKVSVVDIGIPHSLTDQIKCQMTTPQIAEFLPKRPAWGHKGTFGHCLVIAGSREMAGAAYLTSCGALRSGAGMVTLAVPESIVGFYPPSEIMIKGMPETAQGRFGPDSWDALRKLFAGKDTVVIGPGLGRDEHITNLVKQVLTTWKGPLLLDADGLNSLSEQIDMLTTISPIIRRKWVFTPHPGEMGRLMQLEVPRINQQRIDTTQRAQQKFGVNILLKGAPTIIVGDGQTYINTTGNSGMGTAGMGDVLSGIIGGLLCQGMDSLMATVAGVYYHGKAGDEFFIGRGGRGLIASDLLQVLPELLK